MNVFEYPAIDPRFNEVLNRGMSNPTTIIMGNILETYKGFQGLKEWILHDWSDKQCMKLLKNCHKALLDFGKVIIVESILPLTPETKLSAKCVFHQDVHMLTLNCGGKERTKKQFEVLVKGAGFASFDVVCNAYDSWVMECHEKM
ncbi:caffeic acid 3-O-methyltransferase-like protein [Cinnamomum micranthum f. kanehirae]|uniref:Caffeic acid 3-O-methyltransferase-like protein n=1 Tax=Cinnamomum micranthum f. kanehirae TaxID=337451 RepID=A0A3S3NKM1_9MAGN|nr:caffeic acid 3-O-methyltransferase-like protein [Cinnamomum micranthum f. kanehirae]